MNPIANPFLPGAGALPTALIGRTINLTFYKNGATMPGTYPNNPPITLPTIKQATQVSLKSLDESFFRVRFDRLTPKEKQYLRALAELETTSRRSKHVAKKLGMQSNQTAPIRANLIKKGMIYSPAHGDTAFTVPLFGDFMKRTIPKLR